MNFLARLALLAILAPLNPVCAQSQWTVDDDGPADFASLQAAINAAAPGDVLKIEPGSYGATVLSKRLSLLGNPNGPRPNVLFLTGWNAPGFVISHLELQHFVVENCQGDARIDDCLLIGTAASLSIANSGPLWIQRTRVDCWTTGSSVAAVSATYGSQVVLVDCQLRGCDAYAEPWIGLYSGFGGPGLRVTDTSQVWVIGSSITGGAGENAPAPGPVGQGGSAVLAYGNARVEIRGSSSDVLTGGAQDSQSTQVIVDGKAIWVDGAAQVQFSGVSLVGAIEGAAQELLPAQPYLLTAGNNQPGSLHTVSLFGPASAPGVVALGFQGTLFELTSIAGALWLDPTQIALLVPVVLTGHESRTTLSLTLPTNPALTGTVALLQGVIFDATLGLSATNPAAIVLSY